MDNNPKLTNTALSPMEDAEDHPTFLVTDHSDALPSIMVSTLINLLEQSMHSLQVEPLNMPNMPTPPLLMKRDGVTNGPSPLATLATPKHLHHPTAPGVNLRVTHTLITTLTAPMDLPTAMMPTHGLPRYQSLQLTPHTTPTHLMTSHGPTLINSPLATLATLLLPTATMSSMPTHGLTLPFPLPITLTVPFPTDTRLPFMSTHGPELPPSDPTHSSLTRLSDTQLPSTHAVSSFTPLLVTTILLPYQWASSKSLRTL